MGKAYNLLWWESSGNFVTRTGPEAKHFNGEDSLGATEQKDIKAA
ncbi:hypothetical protein ACINKY_16025 [Paenibacillus illinoisensis]|uniref:Uncharacterized protein n=1 Tax=Paenibacillus illinoisensis TaxID=59845 RepID=A0ABW8HW74_9BACL